MDARVIHYLKFTFSNVSEAKLKEGVFVGIENKRIN